MTTNTKKIVILGGGISGLTAAYYVKKIANENKINIDITLIEKENRLGGKLQTVKRDGFTIEKGPDAFLSRKPAILELTKLLGIEDQLVATNPEAGITRILHKGKLHPMPMGFVLGIPTQITPFIKTGLISPLGKMRALFDLVIPARQNQQDESLGHFIERRLGKEVLEHITEPLLAGIYAGDTRSLSLTATFPQFQQMEQQHGSLIKGMIGGKAKKVAGRTKSILKQTTAVSTTTFTNHKTDTKQAVAIPKSMFLSYKGGLSYLIEQLEKDLESIRFIVGQRVDSLQSIDKKYNLTLSNGEQIEADQVISTIPAFEAARIFAQVPAMQHLQHIHYVSVANIALAYPYSVLKKSLRTPGFLVPRKEGKMITACTISSIKWNHTAPNDQVLLRVYIGRAGAEEWVQMTDDQLVDAARKDLKELLGIEAQPQMIEISRCTQSMPQYPLGHREHMASLRTQLARQMPGVWLCGGGYDGVGIPDCIAHAKKTAEQVIQYAQNTLSQS